MQTQYIDTTMIQPLHRSTFDNLNKVRKAWVHAVKGTMLEIKLLAFAREQRFELYRDFDGKVMDTWSSLLRDYNNYHYDKGHYTNEILFRRRVLTADYKIDSDVLLIQAVEMVANEWATEFNVQ